jgi:uncharacterized Ntn-hydrolase superfamily protein
MKVSAMTTLFLILVFFISADQISAQDTFSIVAVDTVTGEIGSAGASCVGPINGIGAFILSDIIEGVGAIHTQASWLAANQLRAHNYMVAGLSPSAIIDSMIANDAQGNPTIRQYGIVDLTRNGESASYTGVNCINYKNHTTGPGYAIQGNILMGQVIIDTMLSTFLNTEGPLADRLMKTLQAAKIIGADTRCAVRGTSSQSSFLKVVRLGDNGNFYLQEVVPDSPVNVDPIDLLQAKFDLWKMNHLNVVDPFLSELSSNTDTLVVSTTVPALITIAPKNNSDTLLAPGLEIILFNSGEGIISSVTDLGNGTYEAELTPPNAPGMDTISCAVINGNDTVFIAAEIIMNYILLTSVSDPGRIAGYYLYDNYPNPFNPVTTIRFRVPEFKDDGVRNRQSHVSLKVFDIIGNEIAELVNEEKNPGEYEVTFNAEKLSSGTYYYTFRSGSFVSTKKMTILK